MQVCFFGSRLRPKSSQRLSFNRSFVVYAHILLYIGMCSVYNSMHNLCYKFQGISMQFSSCFAVSYSTASSFYFYSRPIQFEPDKSRPVTLLLSYLAQHCIALAIYLQKMFLSLVSKIIIFITYVQCQY